MATFRRALCWIRRDLRQQDHTALARACELANEVIVVFVFDRIILDRLKDRQDRRVTFIRESLVELDARLREHGSQLLVRHGDPVEEIPETAKLLDADLILTARDYEPYAVRRDHAVGTNLTDSGRTFKTVKDSVILERGQVLSQSGKPLRVYSPYARAWRKVFRLAEHSSIREPDLSKLEPLDRIALHSHDWSMESLGFQVSPLWLEPGERAGRMRLREFAAKLDRYGHERDYPAIEGTSGLSVHLRFGTISIREAVRTALEQNTPGADKWLAELIWRDFYQDILAHHPHVVDLPFQSQYNDLVYPGLPEYFEAWCEGQTGYPIVDAAMRCLNETGFMHNRLRMVTASFLTKDLLIDYRKGEAYFAEKLLDFDLASNNGGWQWAASTGCDPQPYFRIFNPQTQGERFDADGEFIRRWVPELAEVHGPSIHAPHSSGFPVGRYPKPIVDHKVQRELAIKLLASVRQTAPES